MQAFDLLYYYKQLIPPIVVPSYSLEFLLSEKTIALMERNELKDIYDTWTGLKLLEDPAKYVRYLKKVAKKREIKDIAAYAKFHVESMLANIAYYKKKEVDVIDQAPTSMMLKDILAFLEMNV